MGGKYSVMTQQQKSGSFSTIVAIGAVAVLLALGLNAEPTQALPSFAKALGIECAVCHTTPPQLNAYGRYLQRTGYAGIPREALKNVVPVSIGEEINYDSQASYQPHYVQGGNLALHAAGYLTPDITYHIHQWIVQNNQPGGLDTAQFNYNGLFRGDVHVFVGKIMALPVPAPFTDGADIAAYAPAGITVGEHMYLNDMARWGAAASYVHGSIFAQAGWFASNNDLNGLSTFANTDKTFSWMAAYANPAKPLEAGVYGDVGTYPLAEGGLDRYHMIGTYVQRDPGPKFVPGFFALAQVSHDGNPGIGMQALPMAGPTGGNAQTLEVYESLFEQRAIVGLRGEHSNDGLGNSMRTYDLDFEGQPFARWDMLHAYLEAGMGQNAQPAWRWGLWWISPL